MSKDQYRLELTTKKQIQHLLTEYHYLSKQSVTFKSGFNVGLFCQDEIVGACVFTGFPVPELAKGCFGLERDQQEGLFELSRFVLRPDHQQSEYNLSSWFLSRSLKFLKANKQPVKAVLSYADSHYHDGTLYKACNFSYHGLTDKKSDFWIQQPDGSFKKHARGSVRHLKGEWRPRTQKHRFLQVYDKSLQCLWN
tara:strand:+ start:50 stop:634 length:585 start_codon:yes stop_codon:yes gene_type:complete